jgi:ArsR family transcriptional regulator
MSKENELKNKPTEPISNMELIHVISDSTRIQIMKTLSENGEMCARDILAHFSITQPTLSHHMSLLSDSGLVDPRKEGRWVYYRLSVEGIRKVVLFFESLSNGSVTTKPVAMNVSLEKPIKITRATTKKTPMLPSPKKSILRPEILELDEMQGKKDKKKGKNKDGKKNKKKNKKKK